MLKKATITIALILMISIAASLLLPGALCQFPGNYPPAGSTVPSYAFLNIAPNPAGIGQTVTLNMFLASPLLTSEGAVNMTIVETTPSGATSTLGPFTSDATGGTYTTIVPTQTGNYTFQFFYAGQTMYNGIIEGPSQTAVQTLLVQEEQIPLSYYPITPLPSEWWQTPVTAENIQNWYTITGPWLGYGSVTFASTGGYNNTGNYNPYTQDVLSGHVLWTKIWASGGVPGGDLGGTESSNFWSTSQYWPKYAPVIMNGIMYSTWYTATTGYSNGIMATDLYTGETLWVINTTNALRCGMQTLWKTPNMYGAIGPYIWTTGTLPSADTGGTQPANSGTQWNMYDGLTGKYVLSIVNGTNPTLTTDENGDILGYYTVSTPGNITIYGPAPGTVTIAPGDPPYLVCWNMSQALGQGSFGWSPSQNTVRDFALGVMWAKPLPDATTDTGSPLNNGQLAYTTQMNGIGGSFTDNAVVLTGGFTTGQGTGGEQNGWLLMGAMDATTGAQLWAKNFTYSDLGALLPFTRVIVQVSDGIIQVANQVNFEVAAINARTGTVAWKQTLTGDNGAEPNLYNVFGIAVRNGPGMSIYEGFGGDIWGVDDTNGDIMWYTNTTKLMGDPGIETPYGIWPLWVFGCTCTSNGVSYLAVGHEYNPPLFHGAQLLAVNNTDGSLVWKELDFSVESTSIAYGILLSRNCYDNQIYAFGKGPSAMTVEAPNVGVTTATPIRITGTVMDVSPGTQALPMPDATRTKQNEIALRFPSGVPCVSDESQSHWMEYVYQQQPAPSNATGVLVTLSVIDSNNNYRDIGTATTDTSGAFGLTWTPDISGDFTVIATFAGSNSYYGSCAETSFTATEYIPPTTPTPETEPDNTGTYIMYAAIAIIVAIIIVGAVIVLLLRKR
jgi:hypothetical protein